MLTNGLSAGTVPSGLMRRILPCMLEVLRIRVVGVLPHAPVKLAVRAEVDFAAVMEDVAQLIAIPEQSLFRCRVGVSRR